MRELIDGTVSDARVAVLYDDSLPRTPYGPHYYVRVDRIRVLDISKLPSGRWAVHMPGSSVAHYQRCDSRDIALVWARAYAEHTLLQRAAPTVGEPPQPELPL